MQRNFFILILLSYVLFSSCATVFKGYHSRVDVAMDRSDLQIDLQVHNEDGTKIPVLVDRTSYAVTKWNSETNKQETFYRRKLYIELKSQDTHMLTVKKNGISTRAVLYPKVGIGWVILDIVTGVFPLVIDLYTGNLNYFDDLVEYQK
jgi:hypothetical protein